MKICFLFRGNAFTVLLRINFPPGIKGSNGKPSKTSVTKLAARARHSYSSNQPFLGIQKDWFLTNENHGFVWFRWEMIGYDWIELGVRVFVIVWCV